MARVIWTPEVFRNLDSIGDYMLEVAPAFAGPLLQRLYDAVAPLEDYPRLGRAVPGFDRDDLRELIIDNYRIVYEIKGEAVWLVTIRHGSMNLEAWLRGRGF